MKSFDEQVLDCLIATSEYAGMSLTQHERDQLKIKFNLEIYPMQTDFINKIKERETNNIIKT